MFNVCVPYLTVVVFSVSLNLLLRTPNVLELIDLHLFCVCVLL